jgi:hypothetical protein
MKSLNRFTKQPTQDEQETRLAFEIYASVRSITKGFVGRCTASAECSYILS